jgi:hypothetical protein
MAETMHSTRRRVRYLDVSYAVLRSLAGGCVLLTVVMTA